MYDPLEAYRLMLLIRFFEEAVERLFAEGRIMGTAHTCIGQEAAAVGAALALGPDDAITSTHRGHGHFLARGADPGRLMAELFGRQAGYSKGRGGSQMMMAPEMGFYGTNGITGASIAFATGLALESRHSRSGRVALAFFGDGASSQGVVHESLNLAALWRLPLIALCESNGYAMSTPTSCGVSVTNVADRAAGYGITGLSVDGNDCAEVYQAVSRLAQAAREGHGPALLECRTYRLSGHSRGDPRVYRTRDEENRAWEDDPIKRLENHLLRNCHYRSATLEECRQHATQRVTQAIEFAENSPEMPLEAATKGVYA